MQPKGTLTTAIFVTKLPVKIDIVVDEAVCDCAKSPIKVKVVSKARSPFARVVTTEEK